MATSLREQDEKRIDTTDGNPYPRESFLEYYPHDGQSRWDHAPLWLPFLVASASPTPPRSSNEAYFTEDDLGIPTAGSKAVVAPAPQGNLSRCSLLPTRHISVLMRNNIAQYVLTPANLTKIRRMIEYLDNNISDNCKNDDGPVHPYLGIRRVELTRDECLVMAHAVHPHVKPERVMKAMQQFLCYLGMEPEGTMSNGSYARVFRVHKWNRNAYRLVKNGTLSHGAGRPIVNYMTLSP